MNIASKFKPKFAINDSFCSVTMHVKVLQDKNLTPSQKILFSFILSGFQGSQQTLANLVGMDKRTVGNMLLKMADMGYIKIIRKGLYNMYSVEKGEYQNLVKTKEA